MPEPFSDSWPDWVSKVAGLGRSELVEACGCLLRGCRLEVTWDEEHRCRAFFHNGTPIGWESYQRLVPPPLSDYEAFARVVWDLHAEADGRNPSTIPATVPAASAEEQRAIDRVYAERNAVVALAARLALGAGYQAYVATDETQDAGWKNIVFIELPTGQVSWHVHDREMGMFAQLPKGPNKWDGHDTAEKYKRVVTPFPWEIRR
jgi:hypothetical protein